MKEDALLSAVTDLTAETIELHARVDALLSLFVRYAASLGTSSKEMFSEYETLYREHHERRLLKAEEHNPALAALLDRRKIEGLEPDER
jgi:hypothetical protein